MLKRKPCWYYVITFVTWKSKTNEEWEETKDSSNVNRRGGPESFVAGKGKQHSDTKEKSWQTSYKAVLNEETVKRSYGT